MTLDAQIVPTTKQPSVISLINQLIGKITMHQHALESQYNIKHNNIT